MRLLRTNTATRVTVGPFLDKTDGITPEVALTVTACHLTLVVDSSGVPTLALDADATASGGNNDMVHVTDDDAGFYDLELTAAQLNYLGRAILSINDVATHCPVFHEFMIIPANVYDALVLGSDKLDVNSAEIAGATPETSAEIAVAVRKAVLSGTADGGGSNYILLPAGANTNDDFYKGVLVVITGGTGIGQHRWALSYDAAGAAEGDRKIVVDTAWITNPDNTSTFDLL